MKLDPSNTELLAQKHKLLAEAVSETKEKLSTLQSATAVQKIAASGEKLKTVGDNISSAGQKLLPVTAGVTALGTASVTTAANFESAMSQVQATMGITKDAMSTVDGQTVNTMDTLNALAKKMGAETAFSAQECAEALNYLALAGYDTQQMCDTLPTILNLAAAGDINLASASDMVTDTLDRTFRWVQRQVALTLKRIDKGNGTDYMETIEKQATLIEKHEIIIKQQTTSAKDEAYARRFLKRFEKTA